MSMLAERKRKQKWSLNPRGKDWAQDSNKFGQKLLEKMGWQQGKGLGAKENGITEHIKVSHKNDSKGIGYKESGDQWTEHETNFSALLDSLSGDAASSPKNTKVSSLEKKSQTSRARVHYHKFTRGKDLSRYSEKELANIFGKKSLVKEEKVCTKMKSEETGESASNFLLNAGSMRDYFKKKMPGFGKSTGYFVGSNGVLTKGESDSESETRPSFGFGYKGNDQLSAYAGLGFKTEVKSDLEENATKPTFVSYLNREEDVEDERKIKKKRKSIPSHEDMIFSPKKKSKKHNEAPLGVSNPAFNPLCTPVKLEKHVLNTIEESSGEDVETEVAINELSRNVNSMENDETSKKRKKKFKENGLQNPFLNVSIESNVDDLSEMKINQKKKQPTSIDLTEDTEENPYEVKIESKKKKKEPSTNENIEENPYEVKVKDKKKKKKLKAALENPSFNYSLEESFPIEENDDNCTRNSGKKKKNTDAGNPFEVPLKEMKRKQRPRDFAIDNPEFNPSDSLHVNMVDNAFEVERKTKKSKKGKGETGLTNPALDLNNTSSEREGFKSSVTNGFEIERKKKKFKKTKEIGVANPALGLDNSSEENEENSAGFELNSVNNTFEVVRKKSKKHTNKEAAGSFLENGENFDDVATENGHSEENSEESAVNTSSTQFRSNAVVSNSFEVERKKKKSTKVKEDSGIINAAMSFNDFSLINEETVEDCSLKSNQLEESGPNNAFEVERKKKKKKSRKVKEEAGVFNSALDLNSSCENTEESANSNASSFETKKILKKISEEQGDVLENVSVDAECDLMLLNVVSTPVIERKVEKTVSLSVKRRKSVRFSDVTEERIIPNNDELRSAKDMEYRNELFSINTQVLNSGLEEQGSYGGLDNVAFDRQRTKLEENLQSISQTIDKYQAQVENDINEKKLESVTMEDIMIGEVGTPHGENERLRDGTKLKFRFATFESRTPFYQLDKTGPKKSYKHLIKGDIVVKFKNTNLHEIDGYAVRNKRTVV